MLAIVFLVSFIFGGSSHFTGFDFTLLLLSLCISGMPLEVQKKKEIKSIFVECGKTKNTPIRVTCEQLAADDAVLGRHGVRISVRACGLTSQSFSSLQDLYKRIQTNRGFSLMSNSYASQQHDSSVQLSVGQDVAGVVIGVGSEVSSVNPGDEVVGIIPLDSHQSGCSESVVFQEFDVVKKPKKVSFVDAAGCIGDAVKAYVALHYLGHMSSGSTAPIARQEGNPSDEEDEVDLEIGDADVSIDEAEGHVTIIESASLADVREVMTGENAEDWLKAIAEKVCGLIKNDTWELVDWPKNRTVIPSKVVLRNNTRPDGTLEVEKGEEEALVLALSTADIEDEQLQLGGGTEEVFTVAEADAQSKWDTQKFCVSAALPFTSGKEGQRAESDEGLLVLNGASSFGSLCVQLAHHWGAKVLSTASSKDEALYLKSLGPTVVQVLEAEEGSALRAAVMHESGGLGVDVLVEPDCPLPPYSKHDLISCLAIVGSTKLEATIHALCKCIIPFRAGLVDVLRPTRKVPACAAGHY
ncbi:hypothetical protein J437_LFUL008163 [Ladona fulva]|uniref:Enoyl reductase (ER) domain-containing protein n=1 Tax=Ladona fulva TaxID=123851 RepID=A0A8K0P7U3_LADFU|nr:hypothetical protein J437_LFUL008163 [Ladona fulva]